VLNHLHVITSWGISYYGCNSELDSIRASLGRLQEEVWEWLLEAGYFLIAGRIIGAAVETTTLPPTSGYVSCAFTFPYWLYREYSTFLMFPFFCIAEMRPCFLSSG
jgi:hypothetical protein